MHIAIAALCVLVYTESTFRHFILFEFYLIIFFLPVQNLEENYSNLPIYMRLVSEKDTIKALKGVFIALVVLGAVIFLFVLCLWQRIAIAVGIFLILSRV